MSEPGTILGDKSKVTVALAAAAGAALVSLTFWSATLAAHVAEHEKALTEHATAIQKLQSSQEEMLRAVSSSLSDIRTDQAVQGQRLQTLGEAMAEIKGSLRPAGAISLQSTPAPLPTARPVQHPMPGSLKSGAFR